MSTKFLATNTKSLITVPVLLVACFLAHFGCSASSTFELKLVGALPLRYSPTALTVTDVDRDGRSDIVVTSQQGGLEFVTVGRDGLPYSLGDSKIPENAGNASIGDFDGDGDGEYVVVYFSENVVRVFAPNPSTGGLDETTLPSGGRPVNVAISDLSGDGLSDIVVSSQADGGISLILAELGGFGARIFYPTGEDAATVEVGDFDSDGFVDVVVGNRSSRSVSVWHGSDDGGLSRRTTSYGIPSMARMTVGDLDADGDAEVVFSLLTEIITTVSAMPGSRGERCLSRRWRRRGVKSGPPVARRAAR